MASLLNGTTATGSNWYLLDNTSILDSEVGSQALTTSYVLSSTFTPGAITIRGIAVKIASRPGSTGTISIALDQGGSTVSGTEVTFNVSALNANGPTWVFVTFTPVTLAAATAYSIKAKTSSAAQVNLYRNITVNNWSRFLCTTTQQTPAASDNLYLTKEYTSAGGGSDVSCDWNNTATTIFGNIEVHNGGLLFTTSLTLQHLMRTNGNIKIAAGGSFSSAMTTAAAGTFSIEFTVTGKGLTVYDGGTLDLEGVVKTVITVLNTAITAGTTGFDPLVPVGIWQNGDKVIVATTTRSQSECEERILASSSTVTANWTNNHSATDPRIAEVGNLTRVIRIFGTNSSIIWFLRTYPTAVIDLRYVEFQGYGFVATFDDGIYLNTHNTTTPCYIFGCSFHNAVSSRIRITSTATLTFEDNIVWNSPNEALLVEANSNATKDNFIVRDNLFMKGNSSVAPLVSLNDLAITFRNNILVGGGGLTQNTLYSSLVLNQSGDFTTTGFYIFNNIHSGPTGLSVLSNGTSILFDQAKIWDCFDNVYFNIDMFMSNITIQSATIFSGQNSNFRVDGQVLSSQILLSGCSITGGATLTCPYGLLFQSTNKVIEKIKLSGCTITGHSTADIGLSLTPELRLESFNSTFSTVTGISGIGNGYIKNSTDIAFGSYKSWTKHFTIESDTVFSNPNATPRIIPLGGMHSNFPHIAGSFLVAIISGTKAISIRIRKSVAGDGAAYTGAQPELVYRKFGTPGYQVLATATNAANGAWETISGNLSSSGLYELGIAVYGTTGWVNVSYFEVDDLDVTTYLDLNNIGQAVALHGTADLTTGGGGPTYIVYPLIRSIMQ